MTKGATPDLSVPPPSESHFNNCLYILDFILYRSTGYISWCMFFFSWLFFLRTLVSEKKKTQFCIQCLCSLCKISWCQNQCFSISAVLLIMSLFWITFPGANVIRGHISGRIELSSLIWLFWAHAGWRWTARRGAHPRLLQVDSFTSVLLPKTISWRLCCHGDS